jgi:hypothetical protein
MGSALAAQPISPLRLTEKIPPIMGVIFMVRQHKDVRSSVRFPSV